MKFEWISGQIEAWRKSKYLAWKGRYAASERDGIKVLSSVRWLAFVISLGLFMWNSGCDSKDDAEATPTPSAAKENVYQRALGGPVDQQQVRQSFDLMNSSLDQWKAKSWKDASTLSEQASRLVAQYGGMTGVMSVPVTFPSVARNTRVQIIQAEQCLDKGELDLARGYVFTAWGHLQPCIYMAAVEANQIEVEDSLRSGFDMDGRTRILDTKYSIEQLASSLCGLEKCLRLLKQPEEAGIAKSWAYEMVPWMSREEFDDIYSD